MTAIPSAAGCWLLPVCMQLLAVSSKGAAKSRMTVLCLLRMFSYDTWASTATNGVIIYMYIVVHQETCQTVS